LGYGGDYVISTVQPMNLDSGAARLAMADRRPATPPLGPAQPASFNGIGTIASDGKIDGTIVSTDGVYVGRFKGSFQGPSAEIGLICTIERNLTNDGRLNQQRRFGFVIDK
jgi:hypothetical protein